MRTTGIWMEGDDLIERQSQDVEPILEQVKVLRDTGATSTKEMWHVGRFPWSVAMQYMQQHGVTFHEFITNEEHATRLLADPLLRSFRVKEGSV